MFFNNVFKGENEFWQYLVTFILVILGYVLGQVPLLVAMFYAAANNSELGMDVLEKFANTMNFDLIGMDVNLGVFLILLTFVGALLGLFIGVRFLHKRPFKTLITSAQNINWGKIFFAFGVWMLMTMSLEALGYFLDPDNYIFQFDASKFFILLLISIFILPLQTSCEELVFRGYLMQGVGLIAGWRWVPLLLTSVLFGSMHMANPEVGEFGFELMMFYYIGTGLFLGVLTLMDDSLELALGVHAATNIYGALFVTFDSSALQTPALFKTLEVNTDYLLVVSFSMFAIFLFICAKKYGWNDWSRLYGKIVQIDHGKDMNVDDLIAKE